jgi:alpha-tubulin suppressor-like RCC1 family protein
MTPKARMKFIFYGLTLAGLAPGYLAAQVLNPTISPGGGDSPAAIAVEVTCPTAGAEIHYTLNGAEPTKFDPVVASGGTIEVAGNLTVKAKAWVGEDVSPTTTEEYVITGDISGGAFHALSMSWSGAVWSWGAQGNGRLGNGLTTAANITSPASVLYNGAPFPALEDGARVAAGDTHSVILSASRKVWAFGDNSDGALGDNVSASRGYAAPVVLGSAGTSELENCIGVGAGLGFSTALGADGKVYAWGLKGAGRLGDGSTSGVRRYADTVKNGSDPLFPDLTGIAGLATGHAFSLAREAHAFESGTGTGKLWAWGHNATGQLGIGNAQNQTRAVPVLLNGSPITDVWDISAGENHSAVVRWKTGESSLQGSVWCFGERANGRLGNNLGTSGNVTNPVQVLRASDLQPLSGITAVACGSAHTLALDENHEVWAWGYNGFGAIGDGGSTSSHRLTAVKVRNPGNTGDLSNIVRIAAGGDGNGNFSMAIAADGTVYTWGRNANGQLGNGTTGTTANNLPQVVPGLSLSSTMPTVTLTLAVNESTAPGAITVTAHPSHGALQGTSLIERVDLFLNGSNVASCYGPNWTATVSPLPGNNYHLYGIVRDFPGKTAMSPPLQFQIGGSPGGGPDDDPDGDGLTNAEEALLGTNPGSSSFSGQAGTEQYQYDILDRVTGVTGARSHTFEYDEAGNVKKAQ